MRELFILRVRIVFVAFVLIALLLFARLYFVQIVHGEAYKEAAIDQYVSSVATAQDRGTIFFNPKDEAPIAAAGQQPGWRIAINPSAIHQPQRYYEALNAITPIGEDRFFESAGKEGDPYEEIAFRLDDKEADAIRALDLEGVLVVRDRWRVYPAAERAAHVLGFVGFRGDEKVGRYGLERYFEDTLSRTGDSLYVNFFAEIFSNARSFVSEARAISEGHLITSIEPTVQQRLEEKLDDLDEAWSPKKLGGIVIDPHTGDIIALAAYPTFDPNYFQNENDSAVFVNPMVEEVYEMGSIVKALTMAAGIDSGAVTSSTTYFDTGYIEKSGERISNYDGRGRGRVDMQEVLNQSLNTGAAFVVDEMGSEAFADYMYSFGLGEETGIDLPGETRGILGALESGTAVDYASASFGQGIAVTPVAMVRALASLANGGYLVHPHVVDKIRSDSGIAHTAWDTPKERVLKEETAEEITRMLVQVVDEALLGGNAKKERYSIAAKTGTAQIASPEGGYYDDRFLHSFFGYFPAHDAKFLVFLFALEPKEVRYASQTLAEPFMDITKFLINYYDIPPDR